MVLLKFKQTISTFTVNLLGRKMAYRLRYFHNRGRWPDLSHPKDLSEILISRILNDDFEKYARYADKVEVRKYVQEKGFNLEDAKLQLAKALEKKYKYEKQYNVYKPYIICEELIDTGSDAWPTDYKFTCIHGQPVDIFVGTEREQGVKFCTRNLDWSVLDNTKPSFLPQTDPEKPKHLSEMIEIAKILSADFDFVRVDLYEYKDNVYFGELTFSPWGGIMYSYTDSAIKEYGRLLRNE